LAAFAAAPRPSATVTSRRLHAGPAATAGASAFSTGAKDLAVTTRSLVGHAPSDGRSNTVVSTIADAPTRTSAATAGSHRHRE
jgi:hypothetical protein